MQRDLAQQPMPEAPSPIRIDPVTVEIVRGAIAAAQAEMEALIERTAISAFIREKKDFYTALFDAEGVMAVGSNVPIFGDMTGPVIRKFPLETMRPGDVYWYNDCYESRGAISHSNDQVLIAPVFHQGRLAAMVMSWAHFADIGGLRPGSISPDATDIFHEGIMIPPTKLIDQGVTNEAALAIFNRNSRYPAQSIGDMKALMASVDLGVRRLGNASIVSDTIRSSRRWPNCSNAPPRWSAQSSPRPFPTGRIVSPTPSIPMVTDTDRSGCVSP